jgi:hypothetical protein
MSRQIKIISDGTALGTRVQLPDGTPIPNITEVKIDILPGGLVEARITILNVRLDMTATEMEVPEIPAGS